MGKHIVSIFGVAALAAMAATPAFAGVGPAPEPEVLGGLAALAALGIGYRFLRSRFKV